MKNTILFTLTLLLSLASNSQDLSDLAFWKVKTKSKGVFVGISENINDTATIIEDLEYRMQGTKYEIVTGDIIEVTIHPNQKKQVFNAFESDHPNFKYKYISEIELISLQYVKGYDFDMAIKFYKSVSREKHIPKIDRHLNNLYRRYSKLLHSKNESIRIIRHSDQYTSEISAN